jgi:methionine synthase II (cobalamin-independent)
MPKLKGLTTGIGSLPYKEAPEALDLIFKYCPQIPFWPQLPKRDIREGMIAQYSENLPCLRIARDGLFFDAANREKELEIFYDKVIKQDIEYFKISKDFALGLHAFYKRLKESDLRNVEYIKCQITGPFTFAASIKDEKGMALLHDEVFMQAVIKALTMKALWQIRFFEKFKKKIIMFIDEPYLGCFGSAYTPINREDVIKGLSELIQDASAPEVLWGLHCCGNTDWSIFTDISAIDMISFDAFSFLDKLVLYADDLKKFFTQDRMLCWGIVPTQEFDEKITSATLVKKINDGIDVLVKKGVERGKLSENLLLSPSCGLGTLDIEKSEKIFQLLSGVSFLLRKTQK